MGGFGRRVCSCCGSGGGARGYGLVVAREAERGNDYVGDLVFLVKDLDCRCERLEVVDGCVGE